VAEDKKDFDPGMLEYCERNNLWTGFARYRNMPTPPRRETKEKVWNLINSAITTTSKYTKGALIKYVRDHFIGASAYKDVGKVASKLIKQEITNRFGKWVKETKANYIRKKK